MIGGFKTIQRFSAEAHFLWDSSFLSHLFKFLYRRMVFSGKSSLSAVFCYCCLRADCLESKVTSDRDFAKYFFGCSRTCFVVTSHYQSTSDYSFTSLVRYDRRLIKKTNLIHQSTTKPREWKPIALSDVFSLGDCKRNEVDRFIELSYHIPTKNKIHCRNIRERNNFPGYSGVQRREIHRKSILDINSLQADGYLSIYPF